MAMKREEIERFRLEAYPAVVKEQIYLTYEGVDGSAAEIPLHLIKGADSGPVLLMIMHGNQAGDTQFTLDQYMLSDGYQSTYGTPAYDEQIRAAEALTGAARQNALADVLAAEPREIRQYAYIAHMQAVLAKSSRVAYQPNSATGDEMRLAEMPHAPAQND